jgi:HD-like signal output (HDOD) protein
MSRDAPIAASIAAPIGCLVVEGFAPIRTRLVRELVKKGLRVSGAVNHVDAIHQMATRGVPKSFIIASGVAEGKGLALARGLTRIEKTKTLPVLLMFDDEAALQKGAAALPPTVTAMTRSQSVEVIASTLLAKIPADLVVTEQGQDVSPSLDAPPEAGAEPGPADLAAASGVTPEEMQALATAFDTFEKVAEMVKQNKLPGPMLPDLLTKVIAMFADPNADFSKVSKFVQQHQTLSARLLAVANTAAYARGARVTTTETALSRLGLREASAQLRAIAARAFLVGKDPMLRHRILVQLETAYVVGVVAQDLAGREKVADADDAYTLGLFHNIGPTFLLYTVALVRDKGVIMKVNHDALDTMVANRAADLNALVVEKLRLPPTIVEVFRSSRLDSTPVVNLIHRSMWVADRLLAKRDPAALVVDMEAELLGLDEDAVESLRGQAKGWLELLEAFGK